MHYWFLWAVKPIRPVVSQNPALHPSKQPWNYSESLSKLDDYAWPWQTNWVPQWTRVNRRHSAATSLGRGGQGYFWQSSFCQSLLDPKPVCLHRVQGRGQPPSQLQCLSKHIVKIIIKWQAIKVCPQALEESEKLLLTAIRRNPNVAALKVLHYYV